MKKLCLVVGLALSSSGMAFAQATANWSSINSAAMTAQTNTIGFSPFFGGGNNGFGTVGATLGGSPSGFNWALLYTSYNGSQLATPTSISMFISQGWQPTGLTATNSTTAGRLAPVNASTHATLPWAAGVTNSIMMAGWSANLGATWSDVLSILQDPSLNFTIGSKFFGFSNTGYIAPSSADPGVSIFGTLATSYGLPINSPNTQLYNVVVPEPGTMALASLGGLSMLLARRRK